MGIMASADQPPGSSHPTEPETRPAASATQPSKAILHVDMDAFYASVEMRDDPGLAGRPVVVGGTGRRGVIASASYEARAFGVRSAMPTAVARRFCPSAVVLAPRFSAYREASRAVMAILESFTPVIEPIALDEAFLDVTGSRRLFGSMDEISTTIRERIETEVALKASVGASSVKFVSKIASSKAKPDGQLLIDDAEIVQFLHSLDVSEIWGVGRSTIAELSSMGIRSVADLAQTPVSALEDHLGASAGRRLHDLAWGRDLRDVARPEGVKSIGHETTYAQDLTDEAAIDRELLRLSDAVASRLRESGSVARTITIKVRFATMKTIARSQTLGEPTETAIGIVSVSKSLFRALDLASPRIRLLGVSASGLAPSGTPIQLGLTDSGPDWSAVAKATDQVRGRFGTEAIAPASLKISTGVADESSVDARVASERSIPPSSAAPPDPKKN